mmetsp:Transcript_26350/g.55072  ORF Transcript_26350/g.55072 Transcript_26350/m.55072 type:complete len:83 (+) Transcript_26350:52-300(+)
MIQIHGFQVLFASVSGLHMAFLDTTYRQGQNLKLVESSVPRHPSLADDNLDKTMSVYTGADPESDPSSDRWDEQYQQQPPHP